MFSPPRSGHGIRKSGTNRAGVWLASAIRLNMLGKINMAGHSCKQCILSRVESEARVHWHARKPQVAKWHSTTFKLKLRDAGLPVPARERERRRGARI